MHRDKSQLRSADAILVVFAVLNFDLYILSMTQTLLAVTIGGRFSLINSLSKTVSTVYQALSRFMSWKIFFEKFCCMHRLFPRSANMQCDQVKIPPPSSFDLSI